MTELNQKNENNIFITQWNHLNIFVTIEGIKTHLLCYCVYRVYREITNEMFSLTQSKLYISKFLGPIKVIKKDLNNG